MSFPIKNGDFPSIVMLVYQRVVGPRLIDGRGVLGGFGGGLITFLAARLTRSSLGLAATLCTLLLHRTLPHAINFFL